MPGCPGLPQENPAETRPTSTNLRHNGSGSIFFCNISVGDASDVEIMVGYDFDIVYMHIFICMSTYMGQFVQGRKNGRLMSFFLKVEPPCDQT